MPSAPFVETRVPTGQEEAGRLHARTCPQQEEGWVSSRLLGAHLQEAVQN
jgi:hypothetical protein